MNQLVSNPFNISGAAIADTAGARQSQSRELAEMQTKYLMAQQFPRDPRACMDKILNAFTRPTLAEKAQYQFARGGSDIVGPSIRSAETIAQGWGNMEFGFREISRGIGADGVPFSEVEAFAVDLEARNRRPLGFIVRHWRDTKSGGYKLKDERDIYELCANQAQRRVRACIIALIPGDVIEAAMSQAEVTLKATADTSAEAMAKVVEAFAAFGVTKEHIEKRIQRRLDTIQPAQVVALRRIYASLRDDMSTPADWFDIASEDAPEGGAGKPPVKMPTTKKPEPRQQRSQTVDNETGEIKDTAARPATTEESGAPPPPAPAAQTSAPEILGNTILATEGERKLIINRARNNSIDLLDLLDRAGLAGLPLDLAGLTKDGFTALKDNLPRAV